MGQFLPRGFNISPDKKIRKMVSEGPDWQIYLTNLDSYALAVKPNLLHRWISDFALPDGIFSDEITDEYNVLVSSGNYIISSLEQGPFPENNGQVEAFSIAFKTVIEMYPDANIQDGIYIEEYSLLLPTSFGKASQDNGIVYGRWLTGGVGISIESIDRVGKFMSWLPMEALIKSANLAGFSVKNGDEKQAEEKTEKTSTLDVNAQPLADLLTKEPFHLIGRPDLEQFFNENIIDIVLHQEEYQRMGISFPGATILYGPPGCGKTYAVDRLAEYLAWPRFDIDSSTIASPFIHDTSKKISSVFQAAIQAAPSIIVIDEMEAFLSDRGTATTTGTHRIEEVAEFLRRIPEAISKGVLVFAMTNMIDAIDPAILRRGRFDHIVEVKMASAKEIETLLISKFKEIPVDETVDATGIAADLDGHPLSDVAFVLREAGRMAVKQGKAAIDQDCFIAALDLLPKKKKQSKIGF